METTEWQPFCGKEYGRSLSGLELGAAPRWPELAGAVVAGDPVICDDPRHETTGKFARKHRNSELGFSWW